MNDYKKLDNLFKRLDKARLIQAKIQRLFRAVTILHAIAMLISVVTVYGFNQVILGRIMMVITCGVMVFALLKLYKLQDKSGGVLDMISDRCEDLMNKMSVDLTKQLSKRLQ